MIKLSHTPMEGSALKLNLSFKDSFGNYYVPVSINYTFLAMNNDKETWCIIDDLYEKSIEPASSVILTISKLQSVTGTTMFRKIIVKYTALLEGELTDFVDEVTFEIQAKPYITNVPEVQPTETTYVEIRDVSIQVGFSNAVPVKPVFYVKLNVPVTLDESIIKMRNDSETVDCFFTIDSTNTVLSITPVTSLDNNSNYQLYISGLKSKFGNKSMKEDFEFTFHVQDDFADFDKLVRVQEDFTTDVTVGNIEEGTLIEKGTLYCDLFKQMFVK